MTMVGRKPGKGAADVIVACREFLGPLRSQKRATDIAALPIVEWKGRALRTLRCHGISGKGPHDVNVPEVLLWSLIDINRYLCPYHAGDAFSPEYSI